MPAEWRIQLLGPVTLWRDDTEVDVGGPTARALLAALALAESSGASVPELTTTVWGGPGEVTRDSVYHYVKRLRAAFGDNGRQHVVARNGRYGLRIGPDGIDWRRMQRLVAEAEAAGRDLDRASTLYTAALAAYVGTPLDGIGDRLGGHRQRLVDRRFAIIEALARVEAARGNPQRVHDLLAPELPNRPERELAAALLLRALVALGRRDEAGDVFHRTRKYLRDHLGLDPADELVTAYRDALTNDPATRAESTLESRPAPLTALPRPDRYFTDRDRELARIVAIMTTGGSERVCTVAGMAGVGKTALVVRAAAVLAPNFPDGCLFLDLQGHSDDDPLSPAEALDRVLRRLGVPGERIPAHPADRAELYRRTVAGLRLLIVLDNARDAAQAAPLLPGAPECGVIITSRRRLTALDEADSVPLDLLPPVQAAALFRAVVGAERLVDEPDADAAIDRIVRRCGQLPLAIRIAAARHRHRTLRTLADLEHELADAERMLAELDDGERNVAASFTVSLRDLTPEHQQLFALMVTHNGPDLDRYAVAALSGLTVAAVGWTLEALIDRHLLLEHTRGRYRFHDLISAFARTGAGLAVTDDDRHTGQRRLLDYYARAALAADLVLTPHRYRVPLDLVHTAATLPPLASWDEARAWFDAELPNLVATCVTAAERGWDAGCWQLAYTLRGYFFLTKQWRPWMSTHRAALAAAQRAGDARAEAMTHNNLGLAYFEQGELDLAGEHYHRALDLFTAVGDEHGENTARANLTWILFAERRYDEFLGESWPVAEFYRHSNADRNAAITLRGIALAEAELGRLDAAIGHFHEALAVFAAVNSPLDAAMAYNGLGETYRLAERLDDAVRAYEQGLALAHQCGSVFERARAHQHLGLLFASRADHVRAHDHWIAALADYQRLGAPQVAQVLASLETSAR